MTTQTNAPAAITALVSAWTTALSSYTSRIMVSDGPPVTRRDAEIELWVGSLGDEAEESVISGTQEFVTMGDAVDDRDEDIEIHSAIWVYSTTGTAIAPVRQTAFDVLNLAITAVRGSNLSVSGLNHTTSMTAWELRQGQYQQGPGVRLIFTLHLTGQV